MSETEPVKAGPETVLTPLAGVAPVWPPAPQIPPPGSGTLVLARLPQHADRLRLYRIFVNGQKQGRNVDEETKTLSLPSGLHRVELHIDWCRSQKLDVRIEANQSLRLECGCALQGWKAWFISVYIFLFPRHYLFLREATMPRAH